MLEQRIQQHFIDAADLQYQAAQALAAPIAAAVQAVVACLTGGGKVLACGLGASAAAAQQFAALCVAGFERERPELAALALGADAGLLSAESAFAAQPQAAFARQVRALGQLGDVLLMLSVTGDEPALLAALEAAHERELMVLLLTGRNGGAIAARLRETDVLIAVPHDRPARVREVHTLVLHCLCDGIDAQLLGEEESS
ncbi:MAG: SIS domain-containing protein [Burkholderiaceae bacterium]